MFAALSVIMVSVFGFEVFAAVIINLTIDGRVRYYSSEIGAKIWGTTTYNEGGSSYGDSSYLPITGSGTYENNVYYILGAENSYSNITASINEMQIEHSNDEIEILIFIKNIGDRYILPNIEAVSEHEESLDVTTTYYYFDISETGQSDPLTIKENSATASAFTTSIRSEITNNHYSVWASNSSIDNNDVMCAKLSVKISSLSSGDVNTAFYIFISFMADVQYASNNILSVYQTQDVDDPAWTKFGYNATLTAQATKVEENSLSNLYTYLRDADILGNANVSRGTDDYLTAPVYEDIDIVNVDINTGEIVGKLSDVEYEFEWFGREISLEAGTTLASGRTLVTDENFTVDVYTYFPTMYIRRWVVGGNQWISISNETFIGAVEVPEFYTATCEATIFNPDKTVAHNTYGIIPRSYMFNRGLFTAEAVAHVQNNYGYGTYTGSTSDANQPTFMSFASNLTQAWAASALDPQYKTFSGVQGENWKACILNLLYLVKYANNNSQVTIGQGNVYSYTAYAKSGVTVKNIYGTNIATNSGNKGNLEAAIGSGTIGVYNLSQKNTATYDSSNNYKLSDTGYNAAGMNYGYNSTYTKGNDIQGLYTQQFLIYCDGEKTKILDGYVGSNGYTSVFCLGVCNPWGNIWKWVFGAAALYDGTNHWAYINFNNYDYQNTSTSWYLDTNSSGFATNNTMLLNRNYVRLSYNLPKSNDFFRYFGTSIVSTTPLEMLIGLPSRQASKGTETTGLCDYFYQSATTASVFAIARGGAARNDLKAGLLYFAVDNPATYKETRFGFRAALF